ncbi:hypothetical protein MKW92_007306 [Papaver armeniacum]|nr:hypothetical protein MKW92_007306 [Papaver armeniacum]
MEVYSDQGMTQGIHDGLHQSSMARAVQNCLHHTENAKLVSWEHTMKIFLCWETIIR